MSAVKIIFKRSSVLGKRPTGANLEPGEIGLNTNSNDPGLFFEVNDGSVVKAGPTAYLPEQPTQIPARGELWVDSDTKGMSIGDEDGNWQKVAAPFLGGTNGLTVFVAPDYQNATDSLANDGETVPFITINRAILEVSKKIILDTLAGISVGNNRYLIMLAPGRHCVVNTPGVSPANFGVDFNSPHTEVSQELLSQFNPEFVGGLILPRGVSIIGLDLKKCEIHPVYVPKYTHPAFPEDYQQQPGGPIYKNEPLSSVFRWSGNTYVSNFTGLDKVDHRIVTGVAAQAETGWAIFKSNRAHGLNLNDFVQVDYTESADQVSTFTEGAYYAYPLTYNTFLLSHSSWDSPNLDPVLATSLPPSYYQQGAPANAKFDVSNIYPYYIPEDGYSYELSSYSHHRLSIIKNASLEQLNIFYSKVQRAFSDLFGGQVNPNLVSVPEYEIVAPTGGEYPRNLTSNSTDNSSPYQNTVNHRSDYGMANGDYDGNVVSGFKSVIINSSTAVILQKDPAAYELYAASGQNWLQLTKYAQQQALVETPITSIKTIDQLKLLNEASIPNIRYYYTNLTVIDPDSGLPKSIGIPNPDNDFRHFGFRLSGPNSYMQAQSTYSIGAAIAVWAKDGAIISLTNATTNFGSVAFQSEGFAGIGTLGGANAINKGFLLSGIVRPLRLLEESVINDNQKRILGLGSKVLGVGLDPTNPMVQHIYLQRPFDPATILPYSLKPGSAVFTTDPVCTYRAFFVTDGTPTCVLSADGVTWVNPYSPNGAILRVRTSDSTIPNTFVDCEANSSKTELDIPYIRRYIDPRTPTEKSYGFYIQSTNPPSQAPQLGSVLRLNQSSQTLANTIKLNYQFDPGIYGGISQVFTVDTVETAVYSSSPNFNYKVSDAAQAVNYVVYASLTDASTPWVQSVPSDPSNLESPLVPFYNPQGSYITYQYKNYYAAENNLWTSLYYDTNFTTINGPTKVAPNKLDSPFVITSVLEKTELVANSWQGAVPDPYYEYYTEGIPAPFNETLSYMRGAVIPYTEYAPQYQIDDDDSSPSLGIIFKRLALDTNVTVLVTETTTVQTPEAMTAPWAPNPGFGRPEIIRLDLLSVQQITLPKEGVSVLQLTKPGIKGVEYVRVISVSSNHVEVIRNYYPEYAVYDDQGMLPVQWPKGTNVKVCIDTGYPEPSMYDPDWAVTKATMYRFFRLMGYTESQMKKYLVPQYYGERTLLNEGIPLSPSPDGYANITTAWPVEFNNPSAIIANTHTWQYAGYFDYSRGLPKYQVNEIPRKLSYDFLSTTSWGGRLVVMGANETGQLVFLGPIREALTGQFYVTESPLSYAADRQVYQSPEPVDLPNPVLVYSVDDISGEFNGALSTFNLTRGGYDIPSSQLSTNGVFVFLGGVVQKPNDAYTILTSNLGTPSPQIVFSTPPPEGLSCDIRVVSSDDAEETMRVVSFSLAPEFDGVAGVFDVSPGDLALTDLNSFVFLGGTEQNPFGLNQTSAAYTIDFSSGSTILTFIGGAPERGTTLDVRGILSGSRYESKGLSTVFVSSVDDIAPLFDNTITTFPLEIDGVPLDPTKVNAQNMFVSLGGVMQIPIIQEGDPLAGLAYSVGLNANTRVLEITFANPPAKGTTCNIRVIASDEFLTCPLPDGLFDDVLRDGPGILVNDQNQITDIDSGLVN
jgi:hypothetical protein